MSDEVVATESVPLTPGNIARMSPDEWAQTFMPSVAEAAKAAEAPVEDEPTPDDGATDGPKRGADGKFVAAEPEAAAEAPAPEAATEPPAEDKPAVTLPFAAVGADDAPVPAETLAAMKVTMKAGGVEITKPLADVVRLAQSAQGQTQALNAKQAEFSTLQAQLTAASEERALLEQALEQALIDDDVRARLAAEYRNYTAPEAELARIKAQQAADAERTQQLAAETQRQSAAADLMGRVSSTLEGLLTKFSEVTPEELLGRFTSDTAQWAVNGVIDPKHYPDVQAYVEGSLSQFAAQRHARIAELQSKASAAEAAAQAAKQAAKNATAAAVRPSGTPAAPGAPAKPPIRTLKDASAYALGAFGPT
jgi:hypothetical protein